MFGELSLFDPRPRTASAVAVTDSKLAGLGHDYLRHWLTGVTDVAMHLLQALAQRLRRANDVMADLVFTDVPGRVAKALLDLADRFGEEQEEGLQVHHDLTQEELAQLVGASRETVNKALADFAARGWLQLRPSRCSSWTGSAWPNGPTDRGAGPAGRTPPNLLVNPDAGPAIARPVTDLGHANRDGPVMISRLTSRLVSWLVATRCVD